MGLNPLGSNKKARTTLVFNKEHERTELKNVAADLAATRNASPSETILEVVLESVATTPEARDIARTMYASDIPRCQEGFELIFQELAAIGEVGRDSEPIVQSFLDLALKLGLSIDTTDDAAIHLRDQWDSIANVLEDASEDADLGSISAASTARQLAIVLEEPSAMQAIPSMLSFMLTNWQLLRDHSCAYRALCDFARAAFPTRRGIDEIAETRLAFLREADKFYTSGKGAGE